MKLRELKWALPAACLAVASGCGREPADAVAPADAVRRSSVAIADHGGSRRPDKPKLWTDADDDSDERRTPEQKALASAIDKALEDESLEQALKCVEQARSCSDAEIRQAMVDTLGWFGAEALPAMTPFLADSDDDVRESAQNEWTMAVADIEDEALKIAAVEAVMKILNDEDFLDDVSSEYIGVDEKLAIESLVRIVDGKGSDAGVAKAKEAYELVTGEEWQSAESAARWIEEEYSPADAD